jgi:hypothetical protein
MVGLPLPSEVCFLGEGTWGWRAKPGKPVDRDCRLVGGLMEPCGRGSMAVGWRGSTQLWFILVIWGGRG